jgi:CubicO group peptidase (beta-lactamase class C family)
MSLGRVPVLSGGVTLDTYLARSASGFLVLKSGTIRYEQYRNGLTPHTPHLLMSVSKSIVATVAGALVHAGSLRADDQVCDALPALHGSAWEGCTIQHLLDMRGGVSFDESDTDPDSDLFVYEQIFQWRPLRQELPTDIRQYMACLPAERPHGGPFNYQSILTDMLAWVLEAVTGRRLSDLISELLWQPMGAEEDADISVDRHGNPYADGGISATLRDVGRFGELWRGQGSWDGSEVVPRRWVEDTLWPKWVAGTPAEVHHANAKAEGSSYYSQNWWVVDPAKTLYAARGYCGQALYVDTTAEIVVVLFSGWREHTAEQELEVVDVVRSLAAALA